jgi:hypothetical protein
VKKLIILAATAVLVLIVVIIVFGQSCDAYTEKQSEDLARDFVEKSPTFVFDGMPETLKLANTEKLDDATWKFTYEFQCRHGGYGDRSDQMVTQVITPHQAVITVEHNELSSAVMDGRWNMLTQSMIVTEENSRQIALEFVENSPTFKFDGIEESLELVETLYPDIENAWQFVFQFESRHAGYGDRTGEILAQVITPHEAIITVENGAVKSAVMDGKWDMIDQKML